MTGIVLADGVSKKFTRTLRASLLYGAKDSLKRIFFKKVNTENLRKEEFWAVNNISFSVKRGEALGIIGQNGSGKSTLLRMIYGIYPPDTGTIEVNGKMGALIAVGAGFHPHLTGRENIYLNGTIIGMSRQEINEKISDIIQFSDIGNFIDSPVSSYSSGMTVRLGFAISVFAKPDLLIADEALAVGDLGFTLKCYRKISEYINSGGSLILVSHSMQLIRNVCDKVVWLDGGKVMDYGTPDLVCRKYEEFIFDKVQNSIGKNEQSGLVINNDRTCKIEKVCIDGKPIEGQKISSPTVLNFSFDLKLTRNLNNPLMTIGISNGDGVLVSGSYSSEDGLKHVVLNGTTRISVSVPNPGLVSGIYFLTVTLAEDNLINVIEWHEKKYTFTILENGDARHGIIHNNCNWSLG